MGRIRDLLVGGGQEDTPPGSAAGSSGSGAGEGRDDLAALQAQVRKTRSGTRGREQERESSRLRAEIEELYEGEKWEEIASLYFDARFAITGDDVFLLAP